MTAHWMINLFEKSESEKVINSFVLTRNGPHALGHVNMETIPTRGPDPDYMSFTRATQLVHVQPLLKPDVQFLPISYAFNAFLLAHMQTVTAVIFEAAAARGYAMQSAASVTEAHWLGFSCVRYILVKYGVSGLADHLSGACQRQ